MLHADQIVIIYRDGSRDTLPAKVYSLLINWYTNGATIDYTCKHYTIILNEEVEFLAENIDSADLSIKPGIKLGWRYEYGYWIKNGVKFKHMHRPILRVFKSSEYDVDVAGKIVVDVGAYVGDSVIYFATRDTEKVIAIEPRPEAYREMLENIQA